VGDTIVVIGIGILFFAGFVLFIYLVQTPIRRRQNKIKSREEELRNSDFKIDYLLPGTPRVAFDDTEKKIAFIFSDDTVFYNYSDIKGWSHLWRDKNAKKLDNRISFQLNDKDRPLVVVNAYAVNAEHWMAKLDAILNE